MRVGCGADGWIANGCGVEAEEGRFAEVEVVEGGQLHEEVVRVLAIDDGFAECGLALLEEFGVIAAADGGGFEGEHGAKGELAVFPVWAEVVRGHGHDPVGGEQFVSAACWAGGIGGGVLLCVGDEGDAVKHERPATKLAHQHEGWCRCGFDAGTGGEVCEFGVDEGGWRLRHVHVGLRGRGHLRAGHILHVGHGGLLLLGECPEWNCEGRGK